MKFKKNLFTFLAILFCCYLFVACNKSSNRPNDLNPPSTFQDSAALLLGKWKIIKDSSTNIGNYYYLEGGTALYPMPGVYLGKAEDYFDFKSNGNVDIYANNQSYNYTYKLYPNNRLVITEILNSIDTAFVVTLTKKDAIFEWNPTSPNGGKFFRRTYLKR
jgi:hypothetical protein